MNEKKLVENFKSYINVSSKNNGERNGSTQDLKPRLLNGEAVAGSVHNVTLLTPLSGLRAEKIGSLFVTNYKLTFIPLVHTPDDEPFQKNFLLGVYDIPLSSVDTVYLTDGPRRRRLMPYGQMPSSKVKGIQVVCKNMKVLSFTFENSTNGQGRKIAVALIHHAFPKRHDLLFAYEHKEQYYPTLPPDLNMFLRPNDWKKELDRCECKNWRITCINGTTESFMLTAGETLIVPSSIVDYSLTDSARHFRAGRLPVWVWGRAEGAALLRCGDLAPTDQASTCENTYLELIRKCHPKLRPPHVMYLCGTSGVSNVNVLPPLPALQTSYKKLIELCTPSPSGFPVQDSQYYSSLESCKWLRYVSICLTLADEAAAHLADNCSVVLQEGDGVDYCAVISSLTQLLIDPHYRTLNGFQSLIQKDWLALGHPFCDRLGLLQPPNPKLKEVPPCPAPVFLLFLDCVWQLQAQFPADFQFGETYLTTLWDCTHNQIFDTFLFNCPRDRELAVNKKLVIRPVWDWGEQFSEQDIALFYNPLFASTKTYSVVKTRFSQSPGKSSRETCERLEPCTSIAGIELWTQNYERWLPQLDGLGMGAAQYFVFNVEVIKQIHRLKEKHLSLSILSHKNDSEHSEPVRRQSVPRFYPFSSIQTNRTQNSLDVMQTSLIDASQLLDSQSLLNAPD